MKGRVIALGIISFILMCMFIFIAIYVFTDGIYEDNSIYIPSERDIHAVDGPYQDALHAFRYTIWFSICTWISSMILGIIHILKKDDVAREINTTIGWLAIFLAPFSWIVCICALVKFARDEKINNSPNKAEYIDKKKEEAKNGCEIRVILMGAMSIIAMIFLILYFIWLSDVEARSFINPTTNELMIRWHNQGTNEELAIAELCIGSGAWFISFIIGIIHLSKENKVEEELNRSAGYVAIFFAPINWIICIFTIVRMQKQKNNI